METVTSPIFEQTREQSEEQKIKFADTSVKNMVLDIGLPLMDAEKIDSVADWPIVPNPEDPTDLAREKSFQTNSGKLTIRVKEETAEAPNQTTPKFTENMKLEWQSSIPQGSLNHGIENITMERTTSFTGDRTEKLSIDLNEPGVEPAILNLKTGDESPTYNNYLEELNKEKEGSDESEIKKLAEEVREAIKKGVRKITRRSDTRTLSFADVSGHVLGLAKKQHRYPWTVGALLLTHINAGLPVTALDRGTEMLTLVKEAGASKEINLGSPFRMELGRHLSGVIFSIWRKAASESGTFVDPYAVAGLIEKMAEKIRLPEEYKENLLERGHPVSEYSVKKVLEEIQRIKERQQYHMATYHGISNRYPIHEEAPSIRSKALEEGKRSVNPGLWSWQEIFGIKNPPEPKKEADEIEKIRYKEYIEKFKVKPADGVRKTMYVGGARLTLGAGAITGGEKGGVSSTAISCEVPTKQAGQVSKVTYFESSSFKNNPRIAIFTEKETGHVIVIRCDGPVSKPVVLTPFDKEKKTYTLEEYAVKHPTGFVKSLVELNYDSLQNRAYSHIRRMIGTEEE